MNYFSENELKCKCCGAYKFNANTKKKLNILREKLGFPLVINSGYRCELHNLELGATQTHATGQAVDIKIRGEKAYLLIKEAIDLGFTGVGFKQKGSSRFIHLDDLPQAKARPRPTIWSY